VVVTRSEEHLRLTATRHAVERVRVRKVIVTEEVTMTVQVRREEFRVEREPVDEPATPTEPGTGGESDEEQVLHELILHEEVPVLQLQVVARERVRVVKSVLTEHVDIVDRLRKERIDVEGTAPDPAPVSPAGD
jgi:uncharacterized protein (TIGR02271 family)